MLASRTKALALGAGLTLLAAAVPGLRLRGEPMVIYRLGGVELQRVDRALLPHDERVDADDGDLLLSNGDIILTIGAATTSAGRRLNYGAILDAAGRNFSDDALSSFRVGLSVGGKRINLKTMQVEPMRDARVPFLRVTARDSESGLLVATDVRLFEKKNIVELVTEVKNRSTHTVVARVGDDVAWPGVATFAPAVGEVEASGRKAVPWLGRRGSLTYGLVFPEGESECEFRAHRSETDQTCWSRDLDLAPGASASYTRVLVVTRRGISEVASVAMTRAGLPVARVMGVLNPAPPWAIVTAIASDGTTAIRENVREDGRFELVVAPGHYRLLLETPGGMDESVVEAKAGKTPTVAELVAPQAERLDFRITDEFGQPIPGRLIVNGVEGTLDPRFVSVPHVSAAANEVHSLTGEGRVDIPPGRYRVTVSRGIEWSVAQKIIDVKPEHGVALRVSLSHDMPTPGWISADLHLHARPSGDSELVLDDRVTSLISAGVEFAVATDHNHVTDYKPTIDALDANPLLASTPGVEITTRTWGHFNAYPLDPKKPPPPWAVDPPEIFAAVRTAAPDAVIQVNHPWRPGYGYFHRAALNERTGAHWRKQFSFDFDLIEVINGYELGDSEVFMKNLHRYFDLLNLGHHYTAVGSSDSHKMTNEWAGYPRTYVRVANDRPGNVTASELASSLKSGHATVSLGPFIEAHIGEAGPGDTITSTPGILPLDIAVRAAAWVSVNRVDVFVNGELADTFDVGSGVDAANRRFSRTVDLPLTEDAWIVVAARGDHPIDEVLPGLHVPPFAFTNPIYVDVTGEHLEPTPRMTSQRHRRPPSETRSSDMTSVDAGSTDGSAMDSAAPAPAPDSAVAD
jgi:hypothetical protein